MNHSRWRMKRFRFLSPLSVFQIGMFDDAKNAGKHFSGQKYKKQRQNEEKLVFPVVFFTG